MAPNSDTIFAQAFCANAAVQAGIRYLGHIPFTADPVGECAELWGPLFIPEAEYFTRTVSYCANMLSGLEPHPEAVLIHVPWHGMHYMERHLNEFAARLSVRKARLIPDIVVDATCALEEEDFKTSPLARLAREGVAKRIFQHAGLFDYCVAEALGHLDRIRLKSVREGLLANEEATLRKYPAVSDLAGYLRYGGDDVDCLRQFVDARLGDPVSIDAKWQDSCPIVGRAIVTKATNLVVKAILEVDNELRGTA